MFRDRAEWFERHLRQRGDSANRFAAVSGIAVTSIRRLLAGSDVPDEVLAKVATALGCPPTDIPAS